MEQAFKEKLESFVAGAQAKVNENHERKKLPPLLRVELAYTVGPKYIRVIAKEGNRIGGYAFCFVDKTNGDVLKPASYKGPAKHARGNIFNEDNGLGGVTAYGAAYL